MRIAFAGTPPFAAHALQALLAAGHDVAVVLTQPDRPAGRGLQLQASAVKQLALQHALPVQQPRSLKLDGKYPDDAQAAGQTLEAAAPEVMIVAAYGLILPPWVLALPSKGCLNIHGSLLPRWRGAAPIQRAIEAGDSLTGITIMQMDAGLDTGDMLLVGEEPIRADDTSAMLHDRLAALGARLIVQSLAQLDALQAARRVQPQDGVTYAHKIDKSESWIDWRAAAPAIERKLRAFDATPGCVMQLAEEDGDAVGLGVRGQPIKLWSASVSAQTRPAAAQPGEIVARSAQVLEIACGDGVLALQTVQPPGERRMSVAGFLQSRAADAWQQGRRLQLPTH